MPLSSEERANLRTGIDAARVERFLDRVAPPTEMRAALLEAISAVRAPRRSLSMPTRPAYLPAQPDDFNFEDPELAVEWAAIARGAP